MENRFKFRAWYFKTKEMFYDVQNSFHSLGDRDHDKNKEYLGYHGFSEVLGDVEEKKLVLMQCTGLYDREKGLIYEGDILEWAFKKANPLGERKAIVRFSNGCFDIPYNDPNLWIVVGNVYETPEKL